MPTTWTIAIDWDRDGSYTDETSKVLSASWFLGFQQPFADVGSNAQLTLIMQNMDNASLSSKPPAPCNSSRRPRPKSSFSRISAPTKSSTRSSKRSSSRQP